MHVTIRSLACFAALEFLALSADAQRRPSNVDNVEIGAQRALLPQQSLVPGGVALVRIDAPAGAPPRVVLDGTPVMVQRQDDHWLAVIGVSLDTPPGKLEVAVEQRDGKVNERGARHQAQALRRATPARGPRHGGSRT